MYTLDESNKKELIISNDTFFYLKYEEEPLDCLDEAEINSILNMFPNGYVISDDYISEDRGMIKATFIPYVKLDKQFEYYIKFFNDWIFQLYFISDDEAFGRFYNEKSGKVFKEGKWPIFIFDNKQWIVLTEDKSNIKNCTMLPLFKNLMSY